MESPTMKKEQHIMRKTTSLSLISPNLPKKTLTQAAITMLAMAVILAGTYIFFDNVLFCDQLIGNRIDGRLNMLFTEHWFQVFCGNETWRNLRCFFPTENVLSYSDIMLGFSLPYSLLRICGVNMYSAFKYSIIAVHFFGSIALYFFMRHCLKSTYWAALLAVIGFSFSNGYYAIVCNPQMIAESFLPLILICMYYYITYFDCKRRIPYALLGLGIFILLFYTAFYVAYFTCLFILIALACFLCVNLFFTKRADIILFFKIVFRHWIEWMLYAFLALCSLIPFVLLYLPTFEKVGGRNWGDILLYAPSLSNIIGKDVNNVLGLDPSIYHLKTGFSPIVLILLTIFSVLYFVLQFFTRQKDCRKKEKEKQISFLLITTLISAVTISLFLMVVWKNGFCLWYFFYKYLPGASAIRGISRWLAFITLPVAILFALLCDAIFRGNTICRRITFPLLLVVVFLCNYSSVGTPTAWNISDETAFIDSVSAPPADCDVMYLTDSTLSHPEKGTWELQMDAWAIAQHYDLKTVNGYSGQLPDHWDLLVEDPDIDTRVVDWLNLNHTKNVTLYAYDLGTNEWTRVLPE